MPWIRDLAQVTLDAVSVVNLGHDVEMENRFIIRLILDCVQLKNEIQIQANLNMLLAAT